MAEVRYAGLYLSPYLIVFLATTGPCDKCTRRANYERRPWRRESAGVDCSVLVRSGARLRNQEEAAGVLYLHHFSNHFVARPGGRRVLPTREVGSGIDGIRPAHRASIRLARMPTRDWADRTKKLSSSMALTWRIIPHRCHGSVRSSIRWSSAGRRRAWSGVPR